MYTDIFVVVCSFL